MKIFRLLALIGLILYGHVTFAVTIKTALELDAMDADDRNDYLAEIAAHIKSLSGDDKSDFLTEYAAAAKPAKKKEEPKPEPKASPEADEINALIMAKIANLEDRMLAAKHDTAEQEMLFGEIIDIMKEKLTELTKAKPANALELADAIRAKITDLALSIYSPVTPKDIEKNASYKAWLKTYKKYLLAISSGTEVSEETAKPKKEDEPKKDEPTPEAQFQAFIDTVNAKLDELIANPPADAETVIADLRASVLSETGKIFGETADQAMLNALYRAWDDGDFVTKRKSIRDALAKLKKDEPKKDEPKIETAEQRWQRIKKVIQNDVLPANLNDRIAKATAAEAKDALFAEINTNISGMIANVMALADKEEIRTWLTVAQNLVNTTAREVWGTKNYKNQAAYTAVNELLTSKMTELDK